MSKTNRVKAKAPAYVPQDKAACAADITTLGVLQREMARITAEMNDKISEVAQSYQPPLEAHQKRIGELQLGIQTWCEANRSALTLGGKVKFHNMITGLIGWRARPASVTLTKVKDVITALKAAGLSRFIRTQEEVNKEAILGEKDAVKNIKGIHISTGVEDFYIEPVEIQPSATAQPAALVQPEVVS